MSGKSRDSDAQEQVPSKGPGKPVAREVAQIRLIKHAFDDEVDVFDGIDGLTRLGPPPDFDIDASPGSARGLEGRVGAGWVRL